MKTCSGPLATPRQFVLFVIAAGLSVPVNLGSRVVFSMFVRYEVAIPLAQLVGMVTAYTLTKFFVFDKSGRSVSVELSRFASVNVVSASITWIVSVGLVHRVPSIGWTLAPQFLAHLTGLGCSSMVSFLGHRRFSFRQPVRPIGPIEGRPTGAVDDAAPRT